PAAVAAAPPRAARATAEAGDEAGPDLAASPAPEGVAPRDEPIFLPALFESAFTDPCGSRAVEGVALAPREADAAEVPVGAESGLDEACPDEPIVRAPSPSDAAPLLDALSPRAS